VGSNLGLIHEKASDGGTDSLVIGAGVSPGNYERIDYMGGTILQPKDGAAGTTYHIPTEIEAVRSGGATATAVLVSAFPLHEDKPPEDPLGPAQNRNTSPIVLDLNGNGIELVALGKVGSVFFDIDGQADNKAERTGWVTGGDGLLAYDRNGNGKIDTKAELFGNDATHTDGYALLKDLDSNKDGKITSADANFTKLKVWVDSNANGISEAAELKTLTDLKITQINLATTSTPGETIAGHAVTARSTMVINGATRQTADVWFNYDPFNARDTGPAVTVTPEVRATLSALPDMRGSGDLRSLQTAMATDTVLRDKVSAFVTGLNAGTLNGAQIQTALSGIFWRWGGVENVNPTSRGTYIDARDLAFLEKYAGHSYVTAWNHDITNPIVEAADILKRLLKDVESQLVIQATSFKDINYNVISGQLVDQNWNTLKFDQVVIGDTSQSIPPNTNLLYISGAMDIDVYGASAVNFKFYIPGTIADLSLQASNSNTMNIAVGTRGVIHVLGSEDMYTNPQYIQKLILGDGTVIDLQKSFIAVNGTNLDDELLGNNTRPLATKDDIIHGNGGNDTIYGWDGNDKLYGDAGDDNIYGNDGNDVISGGSGSDMLDGAAGNDALNGDAGNDTIYGSLGNDIIDGGTENDELYGDEGDDTLKGNAGNDHLYGDTYSSVSADRLEGGSGDDYLEGGRGNDTYVFYSGNDTILENGGTDILILPAGITQANLSYARIGDDLKITVGTLGSVSIAGQYTDMTITYAGGVTETMVYRIETLKFADGSTLALSGIIPATNGTSSDDIIYGSSGVDVMNGLDGNDTLYGYNGNDILRGGAGNDTLEGDRFKGGNDTLDGGAGDDLMKGGPGDDKYIYTSGNDTIREGGGVDTIVLPTGIALANLAFSVVNDYDLKITAGSLGSILIKYQTVDSTTTYTDEDGIQTTHLLSNCVENLTFADGSTVALKSIAITQNGTSGVDSLYGYDIGVSSHDIIHGLGGNDAIYGYAGNDTLYGDDGDDYLDGSAGTDTLYGGAGIDNMRGGDHADTLYGGIGNDSLTGDESNAVVFGNDKMYGEDGDDKLWGYGGDDLLDGGNDKDYLDGGAGNDTLYGRAHDDNMWGGAGNDKMYGEDGIDWLSGDDGNDILSGGLGADTLKGGLGADIFTFLKADGLTTSDHVQDFSKAQGDKLDISDILDYTGAVDQAIADFVKFTTSGSSTLVQVDANGKTGGAAFTTIAILDNITGLSVADLIANKNLVVV
jgi:Ca2+-binding RTX toxin-like protein